MKRIAGLYILSFLIVLSLNASAQDERPVYRISAAFDSAGKRLFAAQTVTMVNTSDELLDEIHFNIYANKKYLPREMDRVRFYQNYFKTNIFPYGMQGTDMRIERVTAAGRETSFEVTGEYETVLIVKLPQPLSPGAAVEIAIDFDLRLPHQYGLLGYYRDVYCFGHWYPVLSVLRDGRWHDNPLGTDHQPYFFDSADYQVDLTIDAGFTVAHSGVLMSEEELTNGRRRLHITAAAVRDFTMAASPLYEKTTADVDGVRVELYYLPYDKDMAPAGLQYACDAMRFYQKTFGPYPYPVFRIAETHIGWLGNEFSNIIFIDTRGFNVPDILTRHLDFLISHEMAHQWFYLQVGSDQYRQTWLDEAFAVYAGTRYLESKYGAVDNYLALPEWARVLPNTNFREARTQSYLSHALHNKDQVVLQPIDAFSDPQQVFVSSYNKGGWILDMLGYYVGDETLDRIMREYVRLYRDRIADVDDFIAVAEDVSGMDLSRFFDDWLKTTEKCDYAVTAVEGERVTLARNGDIVMPVTVAVNFDSGSVHYERWDGEDSEYSFTVDGGSSIKSVVIDPQRRTLDAHLANNAWPRKKQIRFTPFYVQLYDFPLLNPSDAYSTSAGILLNVFNGGFRIAGQRVYEHNAYLETRYDFHHKEVGVLAGYETAEILDDVRLGLESRYDHSVDSDERFMMGRLSLIKKMGPTVFSLDKIENDARLYYEWNREKDLASNTYKRLKIGVERNIDYRILSWDPMGGARLHFALEHAGRYFGANSDFIKGELDARLYTPLWWDAHVWVNRVGVGLSHGDVFGEERFALGGRDTLRGFGDEAIRAKNILIYGTEYRFPLIDEREDSIMRNFFTFNRLNGALFYDAGVDWDRQIHSDHIRQNIGFGIRFELTVLGFFEKTLNRFDVAFPIDGKDEEDGVRLWFDITHAF